MALGVLAVTVPATAGQPLLIVAAGDSFASGEGSPDQPGLVIEPPRWRADYFDGAAMPCHRSYRAAAAVAANQLNAAWPVEFASVACSGGLIGAEGEERGLKSLLGPLPDGQLAKIAQQYGRPIDALVLTIGGNDIRFDELVEACMDPLKRCDLDLAGQVASDLSRLPGRLARVVQAVNGMAVPVRHVYVVQYPDPTTGADGAPCGTFPWALPDGGMQGISLEEARWASSSVVAPLNAHLASAVDIADNAPGSHPRWHFVTGVQDRFRSHGYCAAPWTRFINTLSDSWIIQGLDRLGTMHPNTPGQMAIADALTTAMASLTQPRAEYVSQDVRETMMVGQRYRVSITMKNTGDIAWTAQDAFRLGSQAEQDNLTWGLHRVELPGDVPPGGLATFSFDVTAPLYRGDYLFQWRMLQEGVQWFGAFTPQVKVSVQSPIRDLTLQVVENWINATAANITILARDSVTQASVAGTIRLDGVVVGQTGQPFTYNRILTRECEPIGKRIVCFDSYETREFEVSAPGYYAASLFRN